MFTGEGFIPVRVDSHGVDTVVQSPRKQLGGPLDGLYEVVRVAENFSSGLAETGRGEERENQEGISISYGGAKRILKLLGITNGEYEDKNAVKAFKLLSENREHLAKVKEQLHGVEHEFQNPRRRLIGSIRNGISRYIRGIWGRMSVKSKKFLYSYEEVDSDKITSLRSEITFSEKQVAALRALVKGGLEVRQTRILEAIDRLRLDNESIRFLVESAGGREFLESLSVDEFILFWRLFLPGPALFHVTRQGWRARANTFMYHSITGFYNSARHIVSSGKLLPPIAVEFGETVDDFVEAIFNRVAMWKDKPTLADYLIYLSIILNNSMLGKNRPWDRSAVHFSLGYPIVGQYGGEIGYDTVVMVPAALAIASSPTGSKDPRGNYLFGPSMQQDFRIPPEGPDGVKWNDLFVYGCCASTKKLGEIPLGFGFIWLPSDLIVDSVTGSQYKTIKKKDENGNIVYERIPDNRVLEKLTYIFEQVFSINNPNLLLSVQEDEAGLIRSIKAYSKENEYSSNYFDRQMQRKAVVRLLEMYLRGKADDLGLPSYMKHGSPVLENLSSDLMGIIDEFVAWGIKRDNTRAFIDRQLRAILDRYGFGYRFVTEDDGGIPSKEYWLQVIRESGKPVRVLWYDASVGVHRSIGSFLSQTGLIKRGDLSRKYELSTLGFAPIDVSKMPPKLLEFWKRVVDKYFDLLQEKIDIPPSIPLYQWRRELLKGLETVPLSGYIRMPFDDFLKDKQEQRVRSQYR